ncbi:alpha/beta hydrolase [Catenovulum sp. SM1970]|nr:alpha/beta hydrolase-fold protein [Marinifaba aquimaris]NTS78482.1 alpha/beta hydrolase [Marinifaba aquimaris]
MKYLFSALVLFISFTTVADSAQKIKPFEIPRSHVIEIDDPDSNRVYPLFIKLPRSYHKQKEKTYPVIYLTDAWYSFQIVSGATRFPMNSGKMQEAILVAISYEKDSKGPSSRIRDYTHIEDKSWKLATGQANAHMTFIEKSVFSFIEKNYRVNASRTYVGNSLGGLFGAYILMTKPQMFDDYVLGSPSVWFKDNDILKLNTKLNPNHHRVFIGVGTQETPAFNTSKHDMVLGAKALAAKLSSELFPNTEVKFLAIDGAVHETAFPTTATQGLYWLLKTNTN